MGDTKRFTTVFDLTDNLTAKFQGIRKLVGTFTDEEHDITFGINDNEVIAKAQNMGSKLAASSDGMSKAVNNVTNATKGQADAQNKASEAGKKHQGAIDQLKGSYTSLTGTLDKLKTSLTGVFTLLAGGAVAGIAWKAAEESSQYASSVMDRLGQRKGGGKVDTVALSAFVKQASDSGYTSSTDRLQIANLMINRGARNTGAATGAADALEKIFFKDKVMLQKDFGISSAQDLADLATTKMIRGDAAKNLDYLFGSGFSKLSQSSRISKLQKMGVNIDINAVMAERPLDVIQMRLKSITKSVGDVMKGPMNALAGGVAGVLGAIDRNPILPKIIALGAALSAVGGSLIAIIGVLPLLKSGFKAVGDGMNILSKAGGISKLTGFLLSPWGILIALAAIILIVAYRTGVLTKAWEKFSSSAIGKDIFGALQGVSDFIGGLIDKFSKWYEDSGKNTMLSWFFTLCEVLGNAFDYVDRIYSLMRKAGANPLYAGMGALVAAPGALLAGGIKTLTGKGAEGILETIGDGITGLLRWVTTTFPFFSKIHDLNKKATSWLDQLYKLLEGLWNWLMDAIPGARKEQARQTLETDIARYNKANGTRYGFDKTLNRWYSSDERGIKSWDPTVPTTKLAKDAERYMNAPSFAEGIAQAVKDGLSGLGGTIGQAVRDALTGIFPDFSPLTKKIEELCNALNNLVPDWLKGGSKPSTTADLFGTYGRAWKNTDNTWNVEIDQEGAALRKGYYAEHFSDDRMRALGFDIPNARGFTITRGGRFAGTFHAPEELVNQAASIKGPGVIAKSIEALDSFMKGGASASAFGAGRSPEIHVHNENSFDFSGATISKDMDMAGFFKKIDKRIERASVEAVKNTIGQRR